MLVMLAWLSAVDVRLRVLPLGADRDGTLMVVQVNTEPVTRAKLGSEGLAEVTECLWPKDCQTCGQPLADGSADPALAVDDAGAFAVASLHHPDCRAPGWNDTSLLVAPPASTPTLSNASQALVLSFAEHPGHEWAMVLTNPGLEMVAVHRRAGRWEVSLDPYAAAGLASGELTIGEPIPGATASLGPDTITVTMTVPPKEAYTTPAGAPELGLARQQGGLVWGITHALHPAALHTTTGDDYMAAAMHSGRLIAGWVPLR